MFRFLAFTGWIWGFALARYIIWSHRWEGITWLPKPNASSWYSLTDLKGKPKSKYLVYLCVVQLVTTLITLLLVPEYPPLFVALLIVHICSALWWPAFIELKFSWKTCFALASLAHVSTIYLVVWVGSRLGVSLFLPLGIVLVAIQSWMVWISGYAWIVVREPTLMLAYQRRESRRLIDV